MRCGTGTRWHRALIACLGLSQLAVSWALAGEWENLRESYDNRLRPYAKQIAEIEARERSVPADEEKRAAKITRDRITGLRASATGSGKARNLADMADRASGDASALADMSREQGEYLDVVRSEWGAEGSERRKLRESLASSLKSLERANASLTKAHEQIETMIQSARQSGALEKLARIEAEMKEAGDRLRGRWQHEQAARDRERQQRERGAAERERGVR